ncbi:MAG: hypothetical protein QXW20_07570 [Ignisphaera sp.]
MNKKTIHTTLLILLITTILVTVIDIDTQQTPIILRYIGDVKGGDVFAPHLYDIHFNGVNQYAVVGLQPDESGTPFTVYGWSEITIEELMYPVWPKASTTWAHFSIIGDPWIDYPSIRTITDTRTDYTYLRVMWSVRTQDGVRKDYFCDIVAYRNSWVHAVRRFTSAREYSVWVNGNMVRSWTVPSTETTVLEWNPDTATYPERYKRLVLGASVKFDEWMTVRYGYVRIYDRSLMVDEISNAMRGVVNASGLRLFIDPTFFDGIKYIDLSGNGNHAYPYNEPSRVSTENPFLWVIRGLYNDNLVRFRFIPVGWHIVVRLLSGEEIIHIDTSYIDAPRVYVFVDNITINIFTPGRYEIIVSSVYPPVEGEMISMIGFGESLAMFILSTACLAVSGVVAGLRKPELLILVSSLYTCVVLIYIFNPCGGLWAISVSIASLSIPIALLITATGNINQNKSIVASIILSLAIYLPSLGLATSSGAIHGSIASIYTGISIGATIIIMSRIFIKSIPRKTIVI